MKLETLKSVAGELAACNDPARSAVLMDRLAEQLAAARRPAPKSWSRAREWVVDFDGWDLVVRGTYYPEQAASRDEPGEYASFDLDGAYLPDSAIDVSELFEDLEAFMVTHVEATLEDERDEVQIDAALCDAREAA